MKKIIKNKVKCIKCGEILESKELHDLKKCKCGAVIIDGGTDYLKRIAKSDDTYIELSEIKHIEILNEKDE